MAKLGMPGRVFRTALMVAVLGTGVSAVLLRVSDMGAPRPQAGRRLYDVGTRPAPAGRTALAPGAAAPQIRAAGWINGKPDPAAGGGAVPVVDVWAPWCLVCHETAPALVDTHAKYRPRGVRFVSLTNLPREAVQPFVERFGIPWPSGFGAPAETIRAYRAESGHADGTGSDRLVAPTLYVLDARGRVLWSDQSARYRHETPADTVSALEGALDRALTGRRSRRKA